MDLIYIPELFGISIEVYFILFIIGVPIYFFWRWVFKRIAVNKRRKILSWSLTIITTPILYISIFVLGYFLLTHEFNKSFSKEEWDSQDYNRYQMADDIIDKKILIGLDSFEVKNIIGSPTWRDLNKWDYDLGIGKGDRPFHNLSLHFGNNKVVSVIHEKHKY